MYWVSRLVSRTGIVAWLMVALVTSGQHLKAALTRSAVHLLRVAQRLDAVELRATLGDKTLEEPFRTGFVLTETSGW